MSATPLLINKVISVLPTPLTANTVYAVRTGAGFDLYLTDQTAAIAYKTNSATGVAPPVNNQTGTTYTLALTDAPMTSANQGIVTMNNAAANSVTVPTHAMAAFQIGTIVQIPQLGAGQLTIVAADSNVIVHNASSYTARAQYSTLVLTKIAINTWVLGGDVT